jgi:hypothetical protein
MGCLLMDFGPYRIGLLLKGGFLKDDILACVKT